MTCKVCDRSGVIERSEFLSSDIVSMWLKCSDLDFNPGQFLMLETPGFSLRRPFVIVDKINDSVRVIFKLRGEGTHLLSMLAAGTPLKLLAPLGERFPEPEKDTIPLLIGGGIGIVTMLPLAKELAAKKQKAVMFMGAESSQSIILQDEFKGLAQVVTCTDDGSCGDKCNAVQLVEKYVFRDKGKYTLYACGPIPMLKSLGKFADTKGFKCYVSLEERMACGVGACLCCAVKTKHGIKRVCKDGPVFEAKDIRWNFMEEEISLG